VSYLLALDQGTTSSRTVVVDVEGDLRHLEQEEFPQLLPRSGEVEHDPEAIWSSQLATARRSLNECKIQSADIQGIGITNQRETTILWERATGKPVANAVVWQSRASTGVCRQLMRDGVESWVQEKTGLLIDPYFSGTKIRYLLDRDPDLQRRAERGELAFGTVDSFLIWRLTGGRHHVTDVSNASRTLLMNLKTLQWDPELLDLLNIPVELLPEIVDSSGVIGETDAEWLGTPIPIGGIAGDQQAATFGQLCLTPGEAKCTYGTGCFALMNTGPDPILSRQRLLTTVGWRIGGAVTYCLEGSVFIGGAVVQWLRDQLGFIENASNVEQLALTVDDSGGVVLVPAFTGLGAPHWDPDARGAMFGLTRGTGPGAIARAAIESIALQTHDLIEAMRGDFPGQGILRVDGGASNNGLLMQVQADFLDSEVVRPSCVETTALGAAYLAGLATGFWKDVEELRQLPRGETHFAPGMDPAKRESALARWRSAVQQTRGWGTLSYD
jgi:glycerol kinase